jgi:hypothetical protein
MFKRHLFYTFTMQLKIFTKLKLRNFTEYTRVMLCYGIVSCQVGRPDIIIFTPLTVYQFPAKRFSYTCVHSRECTGTDKTKEITTVSVVLYVIKNNAHLHKLKPYSLAWILSAQ